jgi:hypothetical protein
MGAYEYQFQRRGPDTAGYVVEQAWSGLSTFLWTSSPGQQGTNYIVVQVRSEGGSAPEAYTWKIFTVQ